MARTPWIVAALAPALLLAACVTGAGPAPIVPTPEGAAFTQLAVGEDHVCGLREDGAARCWGANDEGQLNVPGDLRFRQLTAGNQFSCGLLLDGALACWGRETADWPDGESGTWEMAAAGRDQLCALDAEGSASCRGPVDPPPEGPRYTAIGAGAGFACGLTFAGGLECWGGNNRGQAEWREGPFTALAVGYKHVCVLRPDGSAFCQGRNQERFVPPVASFASVTAGGDHSCGLTATGAAVCWGSEVDPPAGPFTALASGWSRTCGLRPGGEAVCQEMEAGTPALALNVEAAPVFAGREFKQPIEVFPWPGGGLAVAERGGSITVTLPETPPRLVLDLTARLAALPSGLLLSAAPDPEFDAFPYLYVWYLASTGDGSDGLARLSRFPIAGGAGRELIILELPPPRHKGGTIRFGPDGMLYLGVGESARSDDAQDPGSLSGKIVRIDVRGASEERPYRIPDDNPLLASPGARPEVWARGLRNPWRVSFDGDGNLWVADVGEATREEVSLVTPGANLGWPVFEGERCNAEERACDALDATPPVATYGRDLGCAVIGGVHHPANGAYLFGDYCSGRIWALDGDAETGWSMRRIAHAGRRILSFGYGTDGEVYVLTEGGPILRLNLPP